MGRIQSAGQHTCEKCGLGCSLQQGLWRFARRPCLTAWRLPGTTGLGLRPSMAGSGRQMKGDPSIRGGLFAQQRVESVLDQQVDNVIAVVEELMIDHGVFHCELYFSSNRATVWCQDDRFRYRILVIDELIDPDLCLTFPRTAYSETAAVLPADIRRVLEMFRDLRFADENVYLRLGSLNIYNAMVGLTFSCDGSHSIAVDEFLNKGLEFWLGRAAAGVTTVPGQVCPS